MARKRRKSYRKSKFEDDFEADLKNRGVDYAYESEVFTHEYIIPAKKKKERYTPDFPIITKSGKKIYIETKGVLTKAYREKYIRIRNKFNIDLRFVFQRPNNKIYKGSKTTYWQWAEKNGFLWSKEFIPQEWLDE